MEISKGRALLAILVGVSSTIINYGSILTNSVEIVLWAVFFTISTYSLLTIFDIIYRRL